MAPKFFKRFLFPLSALALCLAFVHPIFVSVVEIEHNAKEQSLEVSCKLFTDDFEQALKDTYHTKVDLINPPDKAAVEKLVNNYVQKHLKITVNGQPVTLSFLGFEQIEEGIYSYYEAKNITNMKRVEIKNNLLYEFKPQQIGLIHVIENGKRKSTRLVNPADKAEITF